MNTLSRNEWLALIGSIIIIILVLLVTGLSPQSGEVNPAQNASTTMAQSQTSAQNLGPNISTNPNIEIYDTQVGTGTEAVAGKTVSVSYVGMLQDGTVFDSSAAHGGTPIQFTLGVGQVIPGWDIGIVGMKVGGERHLVISPTLGYGAQVVGPIPANSTLIFDVTLVGVK